MALQGSACRCTTRITWQQSFDYRFQLIKLFSTSSASFWVTWHESAAVPSLFVSVLISQPAQTGTSLNNTTETSECNCCVHSVIAFGIIDPIVRSYFFYVCCHSSSERSSQCFWTSVSMSPILSVIVSVWVFCFLWADIYLEIPVVVTSCLMVWLLWPIL